MYSSLLNFTLLATVVFQASVCDGLQCCCQQLSEQCTTAVHHSEQVRSAVIHVTELCLRTATACMLVICLMATGANSLAAAAATMEASLDPLREMGRTWPYLLRDPGLADAVLRRIETCVILTNDGRISSAWLVESKSWLMDLGYIIFSHSPCVTVLENSNPQAPFVYRMDYPTMAHLENEAVAAGYTLSRSGDSNVTCYARKCLLHVMDLASSTGRWNSFLVASNSFWTRDFDEVPAAFAWATILGVREVFETYDAWHTFKRVIAIVERPQSFSLPEWQRACTSFQLIVSTLATITVRAGGALLERLGMLEACSAGLRAINHAGAEAAARAGIQGRTPMEQVLGGASRAANLAAELAAVQRIRTMIFRRFENVLRGCRE